ncbi:MAG: DNA-binding response regulator [Cytophagales bacterium]|nr:MAG: DNA-binding response regulator [Cytophagales bacterium]
MRKKIYIIEDHRLLRETWVYFFSLKPDLKIVGQSDNIEEAFEQIEILKPKIVMIDINLKGESGLVLIKKLKNTMPYVKIIVVSMHDEYAFVKKILNMGIDAYVSKNAEISNLLNAISTVCKGEIYLSDDLSKLFFENALSLHKDKVLTFNELSVIEFICNCKTTKEIAQIMNLSIKSIEGYKTKIYKKLEIRSSLELLKYAKKNGIL